MEELLKSATLHRQANYRNLRHNRPRQGSQSFYSNNQQGTEVEEADLKHHRGHHGNHTTKNRFAATECYMELAPLYGHKENQCKTQEERPNPDHHDNRNNLHSSSYQEKSCVLENWPTDPHKTGVSRSGANGGPLLRSENQEVLSPHQPQLCYTPASHIPLSDYVIVDEDELRCFSPDGSTATAVYSGPAHPERAPSPLYADDTPYTILNYADATEPITAIFMGFQLTQDDSGQAPECEASLKAELIVIHDDSDGEIAETKNQPGANGCQAGSSGGGDRRLQKQVATGTSTLKKKHKACCAVS